MNIVIKGRSAVDQETLKKRILTVLHSSGVDTNMYRVELVDEKVEREGAGPKVSIVEVTLPKVLGGKKGLVSQLEYSLSRVRQTGFNTVEVNIADE